MVDAASENLGIFRVWSIPGRGVGLTQRLPFTDQAVAARADWDPIDNPITRCEQPGMPMVMLQPGPFRLLRAGDDIILQSADVEVTERFTLSDDQTQLEYHMTVADPLTFTAAATRQWHYLALNELFFVVECNVF